MGQYEKVTSSTDQEGKTTSFDETLEHFRASLHDHLNMLHAVRLRAEMLANDLEGSPHASNVEELQLLLGRIQSGLHFLLLNMRMPRLGDQMPTLPPGLDAFASILDAQPAPVRSAFQYCLCLLVVEAGKMRLVEPPERASIRCHVTS